MEAKSTKLPGPDHPISIRPNPARVTVSVAGRTIADTRSALTLTEASYAAVQYIPRKDLDMRLLERTDHHTYCPYKGDCAYYSIPLGGDRSVNAVWTYEAPYAAVAAIKDHVAFYPDRVDAIEERPARLEPDPTVPQKDMTTYTHQTAPTQYVEARGIRFAYRRFGKSSGVPLVFNMHFTGTMDHWDPAVTDGLAHDREVILFDNAGISRSSGEVPNSIEEMAANAAAFIRAVGLTQVDVLGFSLGGLIAQELALAEPELVRRLILLGTGPRSGEGMASLTPEAQKIFGAHYDEPDHLWLKAFFTPSEVSQAAGRAYLKRFRLRVDDRDSEVSDKVAPAQLEALAEWGAPRENPFEYLKAIAQPTLVVNGDRDVIIYSVNSWILQQHLPNAQLILYPDANHGSQYQYPERFIQHASLFLSEQDAHTSARR